MEEVEVNIYLHRAKALMICIDNYLLSQDYMIKEGFDTGTFAMIDRVSCELSMDIKFIEHRLNQWKKDNE